ncbi:MAG: YfhO family protein [Candidatus Eisenbacteria bacterium]|nr:YfhO family protein [Candidatus Eisenbacteria bacterium]
MSDRKAPRREVSKTPARPARFALNRTWAAVILTLLVVVFFHEVSVGGHTFVSPDAQSPGGFVRVGEQSLWHDHIYPLWNPYVFLGMPSFGSGAYNPLIYPPDWPLALVQKIVPLPDMSWLLLYYVLGAWFFFLLAREWGARAEGALLGAAAFIFAPNLVAVGSHGHGSQLVNSAYLPLMLWLATRWMRRGGLHHLGSLAIAGGFQMLRGHVQICFYTWIAIGLYALVESLVALRNPADLMPRLSRVAGLAAAAALAFGIAGFYNLPLRDYARWSIRGGGADGGVGMAYATSWSLAPYELPTVVVPGWTGFGGATYWGGMPFTDYPNAYVGMITVLLALPAFLAGGPIRIYALLLAVTALLIAFGHYLPFYGFLYAHLPLFNKFRIPVMVIVLFQLAAALAAAWGWSAVIDDRPQGERGASPVARLMIGAAAVLVLAFVIGVLGQDAWRAAYTSLALASHPGFDPRAAAAAYSEWVGSLSRVCVLGLLATAVAWFARERRMPASLASALVLGLLLIELWPVGGRVMKPVIGDPMIRGADAGRDDVVEFLQQVGPPGSFRIFPVESFQDNRFAGFSIASLGGYHAAKLRLYQDLLDRQLQNNLGWMRLLNVRYIVFGQPMPNAPGWLKPVHQGPGGAVYENLLALPRVTLVGSYRVAPSDTAIIDSVRLGTSDAAAVTFLDHDPRLALGPLENSNALIMSYRLNDVSIDVQASGAALVRLADQWYPDWSATVDGRPVEILKADYLLRAVAVKAGHHRVEFRYRSPSVRNGMRLSIASLLVAALLTILGVRGARAGRNRQEHTPEAR